MDSVLSNDQFAVFGVNLHAAAFAVLVCGTNFARDNLSAQHRFHMALQIPLERSCTINWIIRLVDDELFGAVCQLQRNLFCLQPLLQILHQQVDDAADVLAAQRFIKDDFVQTVEELRSEAGFQQRVDLILCLLADFAVRRDALQI